MKKMLLGLICLFLFLFIVGCQDNKEVSIIETEVDIKQVSIPELKEMLEEDLQDVVYIDVREEGEYAAGHIEGFTLYPLSTLDQSYQAIPMDREIVIICRSGNRSMQAANFLSDKGYLNISNVTEGMLGWDDSVIIIE